MNKREIRETMKRQMNTLKPSERLSYNHALYKRLWDHEAWKTHRNLGLTLSTSLEINTEPIIHRAWQDSKRVAVPKCEPNAKHLIFRTLSSFDQLESVFFGLKEPIPSLTPLIQPDAIDLLIVPGLCFDQRGFRIGFGGGYYDRFLVGFNGLKVGLAYDFQVLETLSEESHDIPVDWVLTPTKSIHCSNGR